MKTEKPIFRQALNGLAWVSWRYVWWDWMKPRVKLILVSPEVCLLLSCGESFSRNCDVTGGSFSWTLCGGPLCGRRATGITCSLALSRARRIVGLCARPRPNSAGDAAVSAVVYDGHPFKIEYVCVSAPNESFV